MNLEKINPNKIKGIILAGGLGTRLAPLTDNTNKHLLPVNNKPMITYPLETLIRSGIDEILIVTDKESAREFEKVLEPYQSIAMINFVYQPEPFGPAEALLHAKNFAQGYPVCVALGDNIMQYDLEDTVLKFKENPTGAVLFLKETQNPQAYGVAKFENDQLIEIIEKPQNPPSNSVVIGYYLYDSKIFDVCELLYHHNDSEFQITEVNNHYIENSNVTHYEYNGWWIDAGTPTGIEEATRLMNIPIEKSPTPPI